ncbi:MAG: hypothetical protein NVS9B12_15730 [Vulcanimicrobiaceae bacterium]
MMGGGLGFFVTHFFGASSAGQSRAACCGHGINEEDPAEFNRLVGGFITHADSGRGPRATPSRVCVHHGIK